MRRIATCLIFAVLACDSAVVLGQLPADFIDQVVRTHQLTPDRAQATRQTLERLRFSTQGVPGVAQHPVSEAACRAMLERRRLSYANPRHERICGGPYMAPLYDPETQKPDDATACIDKFEFPSIPCEYPVVWTTAQEAAEICEAMGKRMCDAHEWEGACEGRLLPPDYAFDQNPGAAASMIRVLRRQHNARHDANKTWGYGSAYEPGRCGTGGAKSPACDGGSRNKCGSNTFPTGNFPRCSSRLGVFDLHGNAAEHMNLPLAPDQMASRGSTQLGHTEMKGSWFVFDRQYAHPDHCRWRAPYWHGSRVKSRRSHHNYHLGFRCCKTLDRRSIAATR